MKLAYDIQKPVIHVHYNSQLKNIQQFQQLFYGMEEEGVPYFIAAGEGRSALELGYEAAGSSNLEVGIGIGTDGTVVLHYTGLKREEALFQISPPYGMMKLRALGANAARLVKGIPFKEMPDTDKAESGNAVDNDMDYLAAEIIKRVKELLKDKGGAGFA